MISVNQRIVLVLLIIIVSSIFFISDLNKNKPFKLRCLNFVKLTVFFFPFIDLNIPPSEIKTKLIETLVFIFFVINFKTITKKLKIYSSKIFVFFLVVLFITGIFSFFPLNSVYATLRFSTYFILLFIFREVITLKINFYKLIFDRILIWALIFFVLQLIFGVDFTFYHSMNDVAVREIRYSSFSQDPAKLAQITYMLGIIYLSNIYLNRKLNKKALLFALIAIVIALSTGSRGSLLGFLFAILLMFFNSFNTKSILIIFMVSLGSWFLLDYIESIQVFDRLSNLENDFEGRLDLFWLPALNIFYDNYIAGIGTGNFGLYVSDFNKSFTYGSEGATVDQPECGYLLWLVESGIIGICFYLYFIIKILLFKNKRSFIKPFKLALIIWLIGFISLYSLTDVKLNYLLIVFIALVYYSTDSNTLNIVRKKRKYKRYI